MLVLALSTKLLESLKAFPHLFSCNIVLNLMSQLFSNSWFHQCTKHVFKMYIMKQIWRLFIHHYEVCIKCIMLTILHHLLERTRLIYNDVKTISCYCFFHFYFNFVGDFLGSEFVWVKKICVEKKFGTKKIWVGNFFGSEFF